MLHQIFLFFWMWKLNFLLFATRIVSDILADVKTSHTQNQRILRGLEQVDENSKQFAILLVQTTGILSPEFAWFVDRRPLESSGFHFRCIFIKRAEVLNRCLQFVIEEFKIVIDVLVVEFALTQDGQLFEHFALHHSDAVLLRHCRVLDFFNQVLQMKDQSVNQRKTFLFHLTKWVSTQILTLNTARIIRVTFSLAESFRMSARIGITLNLKNRISLFISLMKFQSFDRFSL